MESSDPQVQLAEAHARAGSELTDRYADQSLSDSQFEAYLARLRAATSMDAVESVLADLRTGSARRGSGGLAVPRGGTPPAGRGGVTHRSSGSVLPPGEGRILSIMTETVKKGVWRVPPLLRVRAIMSDVKLDLRHVELPFDFHLDVVCVMAGVKITVPLDVAISSSVSSIAGVYTNDAADVTDDVYTTRIVQISGSVVMGEVKVIPKARSR